MGIISALLIIGATLSVLHARSFDTVLIGSGSVLSDTTGAIDLRDLKDPKAETFLSYFQVEGVDSVTVFTLHSNDLATWNRGHILTITQGQIKSTNLATFPYQKFVFLKSSPDSCMIRFSYELRQSQEQQQKKGN